MKDLNNHWLQQNSGGRHADARNLLAHGINPCEMKATLGKNAFVLRMREWEETQFARVPGSGHFPTEKVNGAYAIGSR
jgi:hypothetical protein